MPARVLQFTQQVTAAEYALLDGHLPGRGVDTLGVLLLDPGSDTLHIRLRRDMEVIASPEDAEVLGELEEDLESKAREWGGGAALAWLEESASLAIGVSGREQVSVRDFQSALNRLYREHVSTVVARFRTHLPYYPAAVAAGPFLANEQEVREEDWLEIPSGLKLEPNMFVTRIYGHSMEPLISDGSLCVFRRGVVGSRKGRLVLVRNPGAAGDEGYTVKRYRSEKKFSNEGFEHTRIRLESLNPDYPSWDLDEEPDRYEIIGEFVQVLE
jgi:phage repressor protein C with HTH and peptisase S24 domain